MFAALSVEQPNVFLQVFVCQNVTCLQNLSKSFLQKKQVNPFVRLTNWSTKPLKPEYQVD